MRKVAMDQYVPESVKRDIERTIKQFKEQGAKIRLIRIGYDDFHRTIDQMVASQYGPFMPMLCGYPVEWGPLDVVEVVAVRKDSPVLTLDVGGHQGELEAGR